MSSATAVSARPRRSALATVWAFVRRHVLTAYSILFFAYLMLPIAVVVVFSFNHPIGALQLHLAGLHLGQLALLGRRPGNPQRDRALSRDRADREPRRDRARDVDRARPRPLRISPRGATNMLIFLPLATPEIVLGASLLTLFLNLNVVFGFWTILIAHIMFCISFAVVTVKARLIGFDRHLEEAAMDLGANEWTTFRR